MVRAVLLKKFQQMLISLELSFLLHLIMLVLTVKRVRNMLKMVVIGMFFVKVDVLDRLVVKEVH